MIVVRIDYLEQTFFIYMYSCVNFRMFPFVYVIVQLMCFQSSKITLNRTLLSQCLTGKIVKTEVPTRLPISRYIIKHLSVILFTRKSLDMMENYIKSNCNKCHFASKWHFALITLHKLKTFLFLVDDLFIVVIIVS